MARIIKFTVTKKDKTGPGTPCIVDRKVATALKINSDRVCTLVSYGSVYSKTNQTCRRFKVFPRTQRLILDYDNGRRLKCGEYSVFLHD